MKITLLTLFPEMFVGPFSNSILKHAQEKKLLEINIVDIRDFGIGNHKMVDDTIYGGGIGMLMRVDVVADAIASVRDSSCTINEEKVYLLTAPGKTFTQTLAREMSSLKHLILLCGHYEGIDARIRKYIDGEISIGDFVLTGGELPSMLIVDAVSRLIPGVLKEGVTHGESFSLTFGEKESHYLEFPQYTKPRIYEDESVPEILLSGDHKKIDAWRKEEAQKVTKSRRPDLLKNSKNK